MVWLLRIVFFAAGALWLLGSVFSLLGAEVVKAMSMGALSFLCLCIALALECPMKG